MNDILFKAKSKESNKWVEGYLFKIWDRAYILWGTTNGTPNMIEVYPDTICQYIGRTDGNKMKLFTGDIVTTQKFDDSDTKYTIEYDTENARFICVYKNAFIRHYFLFSYDSDKFIKIGNIWDYYEK